MLSRRAMMAQNSFVFVDNSINPASFPGLALWLKGNAIVGLNDGDPITTWSDSSGNGNNATQSTAGSKPLYKTNVLNGLPGVLFDITDDSLSVTSISFSDNSNLTFFIVYNILSGFTGAHRTLDGIGNNWLLGPHESFHRHYNGDFIQGPASDANFVYATLVNTADVGATLRINGSTSGSNTNTIGPGAGGINISAPSEPANGYVMELLIYNSSFSGSNVALMESYLTSKYAL